MVFPSERSERSKVGVADNSIILDSKWAQLMSQVWEGVHVKNDGRCVWNFTYPALVKEFQISFKRLGVQVAPINVATAEPATTAQSRQGRSS